MRTVAFITLLMIATLTLLIAQRNEALTPEDVVRAYYTAHRHEEFEEMIALVHPQTLDAFKKRVMRVLSAADTSSDSLVRGQLTAITAVGVDSLRNTSAPDFARLLLENAMKGDEAVYHNHGTLHDVVGHVDSRYGVAYVVVTTMEESISVDWPISPTPVVALRKVDTEWRVLYPEELDSLASDITRRLHRPNRDDH